MVTKYPNSWKDNYGSCSMGAKCACLKGENGPEWLGEACLNWTPIGFDSLEGFEKWFKENARKDSR